MKKLFAFCLCALLTSIAFGAGEIMPRVSVFSTTVDWAAVTGLSLHQYSGHFVGKNKVLVKDGLVLYYLDSFPCYGESDSVRVWIDKNGKTDDHLRVVCVHEPTEIKFAWRNAERNATQNTTTGLLECPVNTVGREFNIDLSECKVDKDWQEYK